jgi:voltage-gated potassium channel
VALAVSALAGLTAAGTVGFMATEGLSLLDALYMAVITLSTVGFQEVAPASPGGRIFTIAFIVVGVGTGFYAAVSVAEYLIEGRLREALGRRAMDRTIGALRGHVIVCGFGRLGRVVVEQLEQAGLACVVVDPDPAVASALAADERLHVAGSALEEAVLRRAGIEHARAVVVATPSDPDNVFIALSARELHPEIAVHARAETEAGLRRLRLAGAAQVIGIHHLGGQRIAQAIARPAVVDFLELSSPGVGADIDLEEVELSEGCALDGVPLRELPRHGVKVSVVAIKRAGAATQLNPSADDELRGRDHVVVVGDRDNVRKLAQLAEGAGSTGAPR